MIIRIGDTIKYRVRGNELTGIVAAITKCSNEGDKFGQPVEALSWQERSYGFFRLTSQSYCYGNDIVGKA